MASGMRVALVAVCAAALLWTSPALAAFPGQNGKIAFSDCGPSDCGIFVVNRDGSGRTQITHNPSTVTDPGTSVQYRGRDLAPAWSADGQRIAFSREAVRGERCGVGGEDEIPFRVMSSAAIATMDASGAGLAQLPTTASDSYDTQPAWSPSGDQIAYEVHFWDFLDDGQDPCPFLNGPDLFKVNAEGTARQRLQSDGGAPSWSPDEAAIVHHIGSSIRRIDPTGANGQTLAVGGDQFFENPGWSPDGAQITFVRRMGNAVYDVNIMDADGSDRSALTTDGNSWQPAFSPDGTKIAFAGEAGGVRTMNPDGTGTTTVTTSGSQPDWQPVQPGYPRPQGASPFRTSLVPAYVACTSPNRTHGSPLTSPSCAPPQLRSGVLTTGTPDDNATKAGLVGSVKLRVQPGNPVTAADEADVAVVISITDVRCGRAGVNAACPGGYLSDYEGRVLALPVALQITDRLNTPPGPEGGPGTSAARLPMPVQCVATADPAIGSTCSLSTTADALLPGAVREGKRAIWELGQMHVRDPGPNGTGFESPACPPTCGDGDESLFLREGLFVP